MDITHKTLPPTIPAFPFFPRPLPANIAAVSVHIFLIGSA